MASRRGYLAAWRKLSCIGIDRESRNFILVLQAIVERVGHWSSSLGPLPRTLAFATRHDHSHASEVGQPSRRQESAHLFRLGLVGASVQDTI